MKFLALQCSNNFALLVLEEYQKVWLGTNPKTTNKTTEEYF